MVDIATRVYNHKWEIDPIVRSLIDTDFYKLLMCQSVFRNKPDTQVTFSLINRATHIPLADLIDVAAETARLEKSLGKLSKELGGLRGRLNNPKFAASAPEEVIAETKANLAAREEEEAKLNDALSRLKEIG